jgi:hypothetical protein
MKRSVFPDAAPFELSAHYPASRIRFTHIAAGMHHVAWHTVPERVLTVRLDGSVEYETSDGEVRHVPDGSFVLVEDTHGKGHISRHSAEAQSLIWITAGRPRSNARIIRPQPEIELMRCARRG